MKKHLAQYRGPLTPTQAAEGINAAISNAKRLAEDAKILLGSKRFATAVSLAILALEEEGKVGIIRALLCADNDASLKEEWSRYRSHTEKNYLALMPNLFRDGARQLSHLRPMFTTETKDIRLAYDAIKQLGFYTDCYADAHWSIPDQVIEEQLANSLVAWAISFTEEKELITEHELTLWALHMSKGLNQENLLNWCSAMVDAGLMSLAKAEGMAKFVDIED